MCHLRLVHHSTLKQNTVNIKYNPTPYAKSTKKTGKKQAGDRLIDNRKFYLSSAWRKVRKAVIEDQPLCCHCSIDSKPVLADVVDHVVPYEVDNSLGLDPDNLEPLCHKCHGKKSAQDKLDYPEVYGNYDNFYLG